MKATAKTLLTSLILGTTVSADIYDDFNDGNDLGWSRQSPLAGFGAGAVFTFPNLVPSGIGYQMFAPTSPNFAALGPARAGSVRLDESYTNFFMVADLVDWDETRTSMAMGFLARGKEFGLGTTDAYSLVLEADGSFYIVATTNEVPGAQLALDDSFNLDPLTDYRLTFAGNGPTLTAQIFDTADLINPISTIIAVDTTFTAGNSGFFVYDGTSAGTGTATAAWDNYASAIPEPVTAFAIGIGGLVLIHRRRRSVA